MTSGPHRPFAALSVARVLLLLLAAADRPDPHDLLTQASVADHAGDAARALTLYRRAAEAGLAEAQRDLAVLYDSGRGAPHDPAQAATWYAAAAAGGDARAAFDLAQLYTAGDGVPRNAGLARLWFLQAAVGGIAAGDHPEPPPEDPPPPLEPPTLRYPWQDMALPAPDSGLALVWTASAAPAPARFFVQVMQVTAGPPTPVFTTTTEISATRVPSLKPGHYAWRVFTLCPSLGRYAPSGWAAFSIS